MGRIGRHPGCPGRTERGQGRVAQNALAAQTGAETAGIIGWMIALTARLCDFYIALTLL